MPLVKKRTTSRRKKKPTITAQKSSSSYKSLQTINLIAKEQTKKHYNEIVNETLPRLFPNVNVQTSNTIPFTKYDFAALGVVSEDESFHFASTESSQKCAEKFFENAIQNLRHCKFLTKNSETNINKTPRCISFITATLQQSGNVSEKEMRNLCFVSLSGWENSKQRQELKEAIEASIEKAGASTINGHKFEFIDPCPEGFSEILAQVNGYLQVSSSRKPCTEKRIASAVLSLVDEHGSNFKISGVSNYALHPFAEEEKDDLNHKTKYPSNAVGTIELKVEDQLCFIPEIDSCGDCKRNKFSSLLIMRHYQLKKDEESKEATALPDLIPIFEFSEATSDYLKNPSDCASISNTKEKMTFPSLPVSYASSFHSRKSSLSLISSQASSKSVLSVAFESDDKEEEALKLEEIFSAIQVDTNKSRKLYSSFFHENSYSLRASKTELDEEEEVAEKKDEQLKRLRSGTQ